MPPKTTTENVLQVYHTFTPYSAIDPFAYFGERLMSSSSELSLALLNLQSAPDGKEVVPNSKATIHFEHHPNYFSVYSEGGTDARFAVQRIPYDGGSVDAVAYIKPGDEFVHRAFFVHNNGHSSKIVRDAMAKVTYLDIYIAEFLRAVAKRREQIKQAAQKGAIDESSQRKTLIEILDSIKPSS